MLASLSRLAPVLLRHIDAYGEVAAEDAKDAASSLSASLRLGAAAFAADTGGRDHAVRVDRDAHLGSTLAGVGPAWSLRPVRAWRLWLPASDAPTSAGSGDAVRAVAR